MGHPRAVESGLRLPFLVLGHLGQGHLVDLLVPAGRDEGGHAADGVGAPPVAGAHEQLRVGRHERRRHRDLVAVGEDEVFPVAELLDDREEVIPATGVERGAVVAQLVEDLLHLEGAEDRLDEDGGPDRAPVDPEGVLGGVEGVVPQPGLEVALQLRQVEVGPETFVEQAAGVVEEAEPEVEQAGRDGQTVDEDVALDEVPAPGAHHRHRPLVGKAVLLAFGAPELEGALDRLGEVGLAADHVVPHRRVGVLEVDHEDIRTRIECVDEHLGFGRAGDLHPPVGQRRRRRRHLPVAVAHAGRLREEVGLVPGPEAGPPLGPGGQNPLPSAADPPLQVGDEGQRLGSEDGGVAPLDGPQDLNAVRQ